MVTSTEWVSRGAPVVGGREGDRVATGGLVPVVGVPAGVESTVTELPLEVGDPGAVAGFVGDPELHQVADRPGRGSRIDRGDQVASGRFFGVCLRFRLGVGLGIRLGVGLRVRLGVSLGIRLCLSFSLGLSLRLRLSLRVRRRLGDVAREPVVAVLFQGVLDVVAHAPSPVVSSTHRAGWNRPRGRSRCTGRRPSRPRSR